MKVTVTRELTADLVIAALAASATVLLALKWVDFSRHPAEDAAMLMRYADHWARGHGIVWNIGEPPVDGATDFLYMIVLGLLVRAGVQVEGAGFLLGIGSHALTVAIIYLAASRVQKGPRVLALVSALYFATGHGLMYVQANFGTPFFALFSCLAWCFAVMYGREPGDMRYAAGFALSGLAMGMVRPEGVFLALFMLLALIYRLGAAKSKAAIYCLLAALLVLGGAYFLWRWSYFGYPLPNPFYKKGGGRIYPGSLVESVMAVLKFGLPVWPFLALACFSKKGLREAVFVLIPVAGFTVIWVFLSSEMNYGMRFQYAVLPVLLVSWPPLFEEASANLRPRARKALMAAAVLLVAAVCARRVVIRAVEAGHGARIPEGLYTVARIMHGYGAGKCTVVTTEAGLIPLYSGWRAVDAWGLNDQWIAHHGGITKQYLRQKDPCVIMYHYFPYGSWSGDNEGWASMVKVLDGYARENDFVLAADFEVAPGEGHVYYVSRGLGDSARLVDAIRDCEYGSYGEGARARNRVR